MSVPSRTFSTFSDSHVLERTLDRMQEGKNSEDKSLAIGNQSITAERSDAIIWKNVISICLFHAVAFYAVLFHWKDIKLLTFLWGVLIGNLGGLGVTAGAHRLWAHKSYKAKLPLRIILLVFFSIAGQNSVFDWVRDHRVHHKYSETDADPHNARRGFFFAHVGWLMRPKHSQVLAKGAALDMSDILDDPLLAHHHKYFLVWKILWCFILPTLVPPLVWSETWRISVLAMVFFRYVLGLNFTWLVNSAAHIWGNRPYDRSISPAENKSVAFLSMGEGWHNYHHVFPWDYKAAELGRYSLNITTMVIDFFAAIGWAYDLKQPSKELVWRTAVKHGDGSIYKKR